MKLILKDARIAVIDDLLPPDVFTAVWEALRRHEEYSPMGVISHWTGAWSVDGAIPASGSSFLLKGAPFGRWVDAVGYYFQQLVPMFPDHLKAGFDDIRVHAQIVPRGTKTNWHVDHHSFGALTYYAHPEWKSTWGGELMIPSADAIPNAPKSPYFGPRFEKEMADGMGVWVVPKPNRVVLTGPGVIHGVNRVDADAGDAIRVSVVGFLVRDQAVDGKSAKGVK